MANASAPGQGASGWEDAGWPQADHAATLAAVAPDDPRVVQAVVHALQKAVQARHLYASAGAAARFVAHLHAALGVHLEAHLFLCLRVTEQGFFHQGEAAGREERRDLAAQMACAGVVELLFKRGVTRAELERCIETLHEGTTAAAGDHTLVTHLWEAGLEHVTFRARDELPAAAALWARVRAVNEAAAVPCAAPVLPAGCGIVRAVGSAAVKVELPSTAAALARLGDLWIDVQADAAVASEALAGLGQLVERLLAERRVTVVQALIERLRGRAGTEPRAQAALDRVLVHLCAEPNVLILGAILDDEAADDGDRLAVRGLLCDLHGAVEPLCTLLGRLENMQARKLVCQVLATVAAANPAVLAQRAAGQPWFVARNMAYVMSRIATPEVLPHLQRWARHADARVRLEAARALGKIRGASSAALLCDLLEDTEARVRQCAVWSLAALGDARVLPRLRQTLFEDRTFRTRPSEERDDLFRTYGRLADAGAIAELGGLLEQRAIVTMGWSSELRRGAALALGESNLPEAARLLRRHEKSRDARLREACAEALRATRSRGDESGGMQAWPPARAQAPSVDDASFRLEVTDDA